MYPRQLIALATLIPTFGLAACSPAKEANPPATQPAASAPAAEVNAVSAPVVTASAPISPTLAPVPKPAAAVAVKPAAAVTPAVETKPATPVQAAPVVSEPIKPVVEPAKPAPVKSGSGLTQEQAIALATRSNCLVCHKIEARLAGPAWKAVGDKYKNDANAASVIAANIRQGGKFGWSMGTMPPKGGNGNLSDADIANLAGFIATLR